MKPNHLTFYIWLNNEADYDILTNTNITLKKLFVSLNEKINNPQNYSACREVLRFNVVF